MFATHAVGIIVPMTVFFVKHCLDFEESGCVGSLLEFVQIPLNWIAYTYLFQTFYFAIKKYPECIAGNENVLAFIVIEMLMLHMTLVMILYSLLRSQLTVDGMFVHNFVSKEDLGILVWSFCDRLRKYHKIDDL